jgi:hypothetical protein
VALRVSSSSETRRQKRHYILSLPERALRSLAALLGGLSLLLTDALLPAVVRRTTIYRVLIGDFQRYIIHRIARVGEDASSEEPPVIEGYASRKMAGTAIELAGLATLRFSPLWVFAIAGDAIAGSKAFLERLISHLREEGLIAPDADPGDLTDLLDAMQIASRSSATAIDTPPLTRAQLRTLAADLTDSYGAMFSQGHKHLPRFQAVVDRMVRVADGRGLSIEELSGVMEVDASRLRQKVAAAARAGGATGSELFGEAILDSYTRTLDRIGHEGVSGYVSRRLKPFLDAARRHFDASTSTWTESRLTRL